MLDGCGQIFNARHIYIKQKKQKRKKRSSLLLDGRGRFF